MRFAIYTGRDTCMLNMPAIDNWLLNRFVKTLQKLIATVSAPLLLPLFIKVVSTGWLLPLKAAQQGSMCRVCPTAHIRHHVLCDRSLMWAQLSDCYIILVPHSPFKLLSPLLKPPDPFNTLPSQAFSTNGRDLSP